MKGNVSKIVSDKGAASEQYIDATVGTALNNSREAKEDALTARTIAQDAFNYSDEARGMANDADARSAIATATAEAAEQRAISAETKADAAVVFASEAVQKAEVAAGSFPYIGDNGNWYAWNSTEGSFYDTGVKAQSGSTVYLGDNPPADADVWIDPDGEEDTEEDIKENTYIANMEAVIETVLEGLTEKIRITSLSIVGAYTGWQIYADGRPLSENIIPICESFVTVAGVMTGLTAGFFQNDKEIVRCKMNVTEHGSVKYVNFSDYERISEKNEIEYIQKKMVGVHFGRLNSSATGAVTLTDIPDNSLILLASGEGLKLNAKGQSNTLSATAKHLVLWTGSTRDHEEYGITGERMTYLVYTQDMSLTNLKPYNIYTAYTKTKADAVDGDTGISIVCPVHTYIGVIGAEFPK